VDVEQFCGKWRLAAMDDFLSRLRAALHRAETQNGTLFRSEERKELQLRCNILDYAAKGVDMNLLTVRCDLDRRRLQVPSRGLLTDDRACVDKLPRIPG
jgi:hypothetical protein